MCLVLFGVYVIALMTCATLINKYLITSYNLSRVVRKPDFAYAKTKTQISFAVTAKLISAFVFATRIV